MNKRWAIASQKDIGCWWFSMSVSFEWMDCRIRKLNLNTHGETLAFLNRQPENKVAMISGSLKVESCMNTDLINPNEQRLLQLYAILAKKVFVAIRYLSAGRTSLYHETLNPALHHLSHEQLLMNLTAIGQLSEALHNLPAF